MADDQTPDPEAPALADLTESIVAALLTPQNLAKLGKFAQSSALEKGKDGFEFLMGAVAWCASSAAHLVLAAINSGEPVYNELAKTATDTLLGEGIRHPSVPTDSGRRLLDKIAAGGSETMAPGVDGAANYLTLMLNEQMEAWTRELIADVIGGIELAGFSIGEIGSFAKLEEIIEGALGGQRMIRRVLQPFINATAITPATWHVNKLYRPELLSPAAAIDAYLAGRLALDELLEELARQGHSLSRINTLIDNARKRLTFADLVEQHIRGAIADADVITRAGELGYDAVTARELLELAIARRRDRWKDPIVDATVAAFVAREIDELRLRSLVEAAAPTYTEAQAVIDAAKIRRELRIRQLSSSDERRLALKKLRSVVDYSRALEREGYDLDAIAALELELRLEIDDQKSAEQHRADAAAARALEKQQAADAAAARDAELAARKALPTLNEYQRAYVHGHIDRETFAAAVVREKVAITPADLDVLLTVADDARDAWLEQQERADQARNKPQGPGLSVAQLEAATLAGILSLADFNARLADAGFDADDRNVLTAILNAKLEDQADAERRRDEAAAAAEVKRISLPAFERAVRLGVRTRAQYAALLDELHTPAISKSLILDLLDAALSQDQAARDARDQRDAAAAAGGISLERRRRAVVAGVLSRGDYAQALIDAKWPIDDQAIELALLDVEVAAAGDARARRDQVAGELAGSDARAASIAGDQSSAARPLAPAPALTLTQIERAVTLGLLPPDALREFLRARGYGDADVETIVGLAVAGVPDVRAAQQLEPKVAGALARRGLSLADFKTAVRRGLRTLDQYADALAAAGYGDDDVALLRQLLEEQLAIDVDGLRAKVAKALEAHDDAPAIAELEAAIVDQAIDVGEARDVLVSFGVPRDTAIVFARVVLSFGSEG